MKRAGFTMIELIFVIVILGILAAVAVPKLAATRDDAEIAARATQIKTGINEVGAYAVAMNTPNTLANMSVAISSLIGSGAAAESAGVVTVYDTGDATACITLAQATRPWTGDAATDENATITEAAWTTTTWANNALTKLIQVGHATNTANGCDIFQEKIPTGWTAVKGRSAQF